VLIFDVQPSVDDGQYAASRVVGDDVLISCDLVSDGHDLVAGALRYAGPGADSSAEWRELRLNALYNDRWQAELRVSRLGLYRFAIEAWTDEFATWLHNVQRKFEAGQEVELEFAAGAKLIEQALERVAGAGDGAKELESFKRRLTDGSAEERMSAAVEPSLGALMAAHPNREFSTSSKVFELRVEPEYARFSSWYELFPRSFGKDGSHGTFDDVAETMLPYVSSLGFNVLYLPPIHPIGKTFRKGPNNSLQAAAGDPGSPWAIGGQEGGHKEIHPDLGSVEQFQRLVKKARERGIEVALDIAFQASPDHPYVQAHPEWFMHRADGTIQYAENPPKKYQDVYPFDLSGPAWEPLWLELKSVFEVWISRGVRVFRVDNPHTKPLAFWQWCLDCLKRDHPDVIFLAEAFTRPKLMYALAKVGFSQSYTYFTWRTTAWELRSYMEELTKTEVGNFFRPNFWPNTPDILPEHLQHGGRPMFVCRAVLAATLSSNWGIYGPAFELMEHEARPGAEEYVDNEKYQLRRWDVSREDSLGPIIERLNRIRREHPALQRNDTLVFHESDNPHFLVYSKRDAKGENVLLMVVNLEPYHHHSGWLSLDLKALGVVESQAFQVHDQMSDARYQWQDSRAYVELDPAMPAHVFLVRHHRRTERSFEYYL
jgi:starch synthase (maltosyl-transferring)